MEKYFILLCCLFLAGCSSDEIEINEQEAKVKVLNAVMETSGCEITSYDFKDIGEIQVTNDAENLFVTITSTADNYLLSGTKLHIAGSESEFPTVGQGNLPPGQMNHKLDFDPNVKSHTFTFPLSEFEGCVYIASQSTFSDGENSTTTWAGDHQVKHGNWAYFEYCIQNCVPECEPLYTGPSELWGSITYTDAKAIPSVDEARKLFANLVDPDHYHSNYRELSDFTRYSPRIPALVTEFNTELNEPFDTYTLTTIYTYGSGDCSGTIELNLIVTDDRELQ